MDLIPSHTNPKSYCILSYSTSKISITYTVSTIKLFIMDYYHQDRETLGDLPFLSSSHFGALGNDYWKERGFSSSMNWRSNGYRGCPQESPRLYSFVVCYHVFNMNFR